MDYHRTHVFMVSNDGYDLSTHYLAGRVSRPLGFRSFRTQRVKVQSRYQRLHVGIDGEVFTLSTPLTITSVPQSLLVKVPK